MNPQKITETPARCWEYFHCSQKDCPAYEADDSHCWLRSGTYCHDEIQGEWYEKMEACISCDLFKENMDSQEWGKTLELISKQFEHYRTMVENEQKELKESQKKLQEFKISSVYLLKELDKKSQEVQEERDNLEKRVHERTRELLEAQNKLIQSTKMVAIGRFSSGIAHEINNPLGAIINFARTLLGNPEIKSQDRGMWNSF